MKPFRPNYLIYSVLLLISFALYFVNWIRCADNSSMETLYTLVLSLAISIFSSALVAFLIDLANCGVENKRVAEKRKLYFALLERQIGKFLSLFATACTHRSVSNDIHDFSYWFDKAFQEHLHDNEMLDIVEAAVDIVSTIDEIDSHSASLLQDRFLNKEQLEAFKKIRRCCLEIIYELHLKIEVQKNSVEQNRARIVINLEEVKNDLIDAFSKIDFLEKYNKYQYGHGSEGIIADLAYRAVYNYYRKSL